LLSEIAEWADEIGEHLDDDGHTAPFSRILVVFPSLPRVPCHRSPLVTDVSVIGALGAPGHERRCVPGCR
jgi:hypothetical protein